MAKLSCLFRIISLLGITLTPQAVLSAPLDQYFRKMLQNPEVAVILNAYNKNYKTDPAVRASTDSQVKIICERAYLSVARGGKGWKEALVMQILTENETKRYDFVAGGVFIFNKVNEFCPQYQ